MTGTHHWRYVAILSTIGLLLGGSVAGAAEGTVALKLRTRVETSPGSQRYHTVVRPETWDPSKTAIIVCDVWDAHHCLNAVRRLEEFAPRLEAFLKESRGRGMTIIHAP